MAESGNKNILNLDFKDPDICLKILYNIKYTRLEGLVVEFEFDRIFNRGLINKGWQLFDNMVLKLKNAAGEEQILVFQENNNSRPEELIRELKKTGLPVRFVEQNNEDGSLIINYENDRFQVKSSVTCDKLLGPSKISEESKFRINSMYWGVCHNMGDRFIKYLKDILIKDYFLSQKKIFIWDIDRFYKSPDGNLHFMEIKHKYPTRALTFGMNVGEVDIAKLLGKSGFRTWHLILVKPYWNRKISSMYLFSDRQAREEALWLVGDMNSDGFFEKPVRFAPQNTSIYKTQKVRYQNINISSLFLIGENSKPSVELSENLLAFLGQNHNLVRVNKSILQDHRLTV